MAGFRQRWVLNAESRRFMPSSFSTRFSSGISTLSNTTSLRYSPPIVWKLGRAVRPFTPPGTSTQPMPFAPGTLLTRVKTTNISAMSAREMSVFTPFTITRSPFTSVLVV